MPLPKQVADWPEDWRHAFEERAGIQQYDGGMQRSRAEREAEAALRRLYARREQERERERRTG